MINYFKILFPLITCSLFLLGCTLSEVTQKTKDGFYSSKSYISEKSKKAYRNVLEKQATKTVKQLEKAEQLEEFKFDKNILDKFFKKL